VYLVSWRYDLQLEEVGGMRQGKGMGISNRFACVVMFAALLFALVGCANETPQTTPGPQPIDDSGQTDEMFNDEVANDELYVFQIDGQSTIVGEYFYQMYLPTSKELEEGHFYRVVADVTYLNGGIAGYVNYPEIESVKSCDEVSPFDIGLPSIRDKSYGLLLIGDYADGDLLFREMGTRAVWKDGAWIYRYDNDIELSDGRAACVREGITTDDVQEGMKQGVLSCEDYFVLPS